MQDKDTVIIDVRNAYESAIGSFKPPPGGAELIDPKMRNSIEFPKWLNDPKTAEKINNKKVLMYCTGGIRCERASALLNEMATVNPDLNPKGVYELRGGIERYVKTFPEGGFWNGKNYLFDRRMEQVPGNRSAEAVEGGMDAKCCLCRKPWTVYRGQFKCCRSLCGVPVIVCQACSTKANTQPQTLTCELCKEGYHAVGEQSRPDLMNLKRKAEAILAASSGKSSAASDGTATVASDAKKQKPDKAGITAVQNTPDSDMMCTKRVFLSRLPLTVTMSKLRTALCKESEEEVEAKKTLAATKEAAAAAAETEVNKRDKKKKRANSFDSDSDSDSGAATAAVSVSSATTSTTATLDKSNTSLKKGPLLHVQWLVDKNTGAFYGSAIAEFACLDSACYAVYSTSTANRSTGVTIDGKKIRAAYVKGDALKEEFPPVGYAETEYPPVGR